MSSFTFNAKIARWILLTLIHNTWQVQIKLFLCKFIDLSFAQTFCCHHNNNSGISSNVCIPIRSFLRRRDRRNLHWKEPWVIEWLYKSSLCGLLRAWNQSLAKGPPCFLSTFVKRWATYLFTHRKTRPLFTASSSSRHNEALWGSAS